MFLFLTLVVALAGALFLFLRYHFDYWTRRGVPHERPILILGSMKGLGKTVQFRDINQRLYKKFKGTAPFTGMYFLLSKSALILDLDLIKTILIKDFSNFHDRGIYHNVKDDPLTGHLVNIEGQQWRSLRNKLTPIFTSGKMKFMFPTVVGVSEHLIETCAELAAADEDRVVEMKELCARYTTDVIGTCAFGLECNSLKDPNAEFRRKGRSIFGKPRHSQLVQTCMFMMPKLAKFFGMKTFPDDVTGFFLNAVRTTVEYRIKNNVRRNDFMDLLIELKAKDAEKHLHKSDGIDLSHGLTMEQMAAQAFVFFAAGFDTSSITMAFCLYELASNEAVQSKLREEIEQVLQAHQNELNYEAMNEMTYLEQVIDETLRKYPVLPHLARQTIADYEVPNSKHVIEAGTTIIIPLDAIQRDEEYFPEPDKFDPTRFELEQVKQRHPMSYLPFGDGPRACIGLRFGKMQAKIGLISLIRNFKFTKSSRTDEPLLFDMNKILLSAKNGIYLHAERVK